MMSSRYNRDNLKPEVAGLFTALAAQRPARILDYNAMRAVSDLTDAAFNIGAPDIAIEREITIPGPAGGMRALVFSPVIAPDGSLPVILHFHGGGYVIMTPKTYAKTWKHAANETPAVVVSLDYRLAPDAPYPAAVDDAVAAFRWLRQYAGEIGGDPTRIAVAGESAGGGLAPALAMRLAADGDLPPAAVAIICPWVDATMSSESMLALGPDDPVLDTELLGYWRDLYVPDVARRREAYASPLFGDVANFPPAFVAVGGIDPLCAEGEAFADRLKDAGREVEFVRYEGMPHIFEVWPQFGALPEVADVMHRLPEFLRRTL